MRRMPTFSKKNVRSQQDKKKKLPPIARKPWTRNGFRAADVEMIVEFVRKTGIAEKVDEQRRFEGYIKGTKAGRRPFITTETLISLLVMWARSENSYHFTALASAVMGLSDQCRELLGLPLQQPTINRTGGAVEAEDAAGTRYFDYEDPSAYTTVRGWVNEAVLRLQQAIEPFSDVSYQSRVTVREYRAALARRKEDTDRYRARVDFAHEVFNTLLFGAHDLIPEEFRPNANEPWNLGVDESHIVQAQRGHPTFENTRTHPTIEDHFNDCVDPACAVCTRRMSIYLESRWVPEKPHMTKSSGGSGTDPRYHFCSGVTVATRYHDVGSSYPALAVGLSLDHPSKRTAENAIKAMLPVANDAHAQLGYVVGDLAYGPGTRVEKYQRLIHQFGGKIVMDYRKDFTSEWKIVDGAVFVDGRFYSPSLPEKYRTASIRFLNEKVTEEEYISLLTTRAKFELYVKEKRVRKDGSIVLLVSCPHLYGTVSCPLAALLKPIGRAPDLEPHPILPSMVPAEEDRASVCGHAGTRQIILTPAVEKLYQDLPFKSDEWYRHFTPGRELSEGFFSDLKSGAGSDFGGVGRRNARKFSTNLILMFVAVMRENFWRIHKYVQGKLSKLRPKPAPPPKGGSGLSAPEGQIIQTVPDSDNPAQPQAPPGRAA